MYLGSGSAGGHGGTLSFQWLVSGGWVAVSTFCALGRSIGYAFAASTDSFSALGEPEFSFMAAFKAFPNGTRARESLREWPLVNVAGGLRWCHRRGSRSSGLLIWWVRVAVRSFVYSRGAMGFAWTGSVRGALYSDSYAASNPSTYFFASFCLIRAGPVGERVVGSK